MKKSIVYLIIVVSIAVAIAICFSRPDNSTNFDARNATFKVENTPVTLVDGVAEVALASIPGAKITTRYFGHELKHDLDNDGREDLVFLVTQTGGGSGTFFYVVAVLDTVNGHVGSDSYFLGDRIAPQSVNLDEGVTVRETLRDNVIVVNYAVRKPDEPMTVAPSVGESVWLKLDPVTLKFGEVAQDFEGESR